MRKLLCLAGAMLLSACNPVADTKAAESGVTAFHQAMNAGRYAEIYDESSQDMKSAISRDDFIKLLGAMHDKLGPFESGKTTNWNDNSTTGGHYVTLVRSAKFGRGPGTENFMFRMEGGRAVLAGYHVNSDLLITG